jgi:hypothetical protein
VKNTNIQTQGKAKPNRKPVFGDPALELVYRSWQRNRERAPELALKVVEAYAQAHRLSVRDLLRRFAEAEAREASQVPQAAPEAHGGPSGEGAGTAPPPLASEAATALQRPEEGFLASHVQDAILAVQQSIGDPLGVDSSGLPLGGGLRYPAPGLQGLEETRYPVDCCTPPRPARSRLQDWVSWGRDLIEKTLAETPEEDPERRGALEDLLALLEGKGLEAGPVKLFLLLAYLGRRYLREKYGVKASRKARAHRLPGRPQGKGGQGPEEALGLPELLVRWTGVGRPSPEVCTHRPLDIASSFALTPGPPGAARAPSRPWRSAWPTTFGLPR